MSTEIWQDSFSVLLSIVDNYQADTEAESRIAASTSESSEESGDLSQESYED